MSPVKQTNKLHVTLYNDTVGITFYPDSHRYKKDGETTYLISATAAVGIVDKSAALMIWALRLAGDYLRKGIDSTDRKDLNHGYLHELITESLTQHKVKKEEAASVGKFVHDYAEAFGKAQLEKVEAPELPELPEDTEEQRAFANAVYSGINAFLEFVNTHSVKYVAVERLVYSKKYGFCGLLDAIAYVDGKLTLMDYKTSKDVYSTHQYQVAGYEIAYHEELFYKANELYDLHDNDDFNTQAQRVETWNAHIAELEKAEKQRIEQVLILKFGKEDGQLTVHPIDEEDRELNRDAFLGCVTVKAREKQLTKWGD